MLLTNKTALIFGAGGALGGAVARAFAAEGAQLFLSGRTLAKVEALAQEITAAGGAASASQVDALDEASVNEHVAAVVRTAGRVDVTLNAIGFQAVQGVPLVDLAMQDFQHPITTWTSSQFLTARAAARQMVAQRSGVILTLSASPARLAVAMTGGFGVACAAIEGLTRTLAAELGPHGVRAVCLRPHRIEDAMPPEADLPMTKSEFRAFLEGMTLTKQLPTLAGVAQTAAFLASDHAAAITGTVANLTSGASVD